MIVDLMLPELGENIKSGVVVKNLVQIGDMVEVDQPVVEIETDKAVVELPSDTAGIITAIFVSEGDEIKIGQKILSIDSDAAGRVSTDKSTDKDVVEVLSSNNTTPPPDTLPEPEPSPNQEDKERVKPQTSTSRMQAPAAPSVRRFAREIGVEINTVVGTGPGGRISIEDVKDYSRTYRSPEGGSPAETATHQIETLPDFSKWGEIERTPMSMIRKKTAGHLGYAWATIPQVTQFDEADITDLEKFRKEHSDRTQAQGGKLTITAILLKIIAEAMKLFPRINASVDMENKEVIYKKYFHIGVAVDTERGLLVPVVHDVDQMNLIQIAMQLTQLAEKARNGKLSLKEMQGGNFTISNLGGIGGTAFTPIVNAPEVAILGVSRSMLQPRYIHRRPRPRLILPLSLSYDHRIIDGAEGARFLRWIVKAIEQPLLLALEG